MDTLEGGGAAKSGNSVVEVEKTKKPHSLRGDARGKPINAESSEYDIMSNAPPQLWLQKYCLQDFLTPESKKLYKEAKTAYAGVKVEEADSDGSDEFDTVATKKAKWFSMVSEVMAARRRAFLRGILSAPALSRPRKVNAPNTVKQENEEVFDGVLRIN